MDAFGYVVFGIAFGAATVLTHYLLQYGKKYSERKVIAQLERSIELQNKVKDRFGWR